MFELTYSPSAMSGNLVYLLAAWFLFILLASDKGYKTHAIIISAASILNLSTNSLTDNFTYEQCLNVLIMWDGVTALILTMFMVFDKIAWKQALLLAFAVMCHTMILYDLTITSTPFSNFFYTWYDELIIAVGLLQMGASYNGIITALRNAQVYLSGTFGGSGNHSKGILTCKNGATKP